MLLTVPLDIDDIIRRNLRRLMDQAGHKKQKEFASFVGVDAAYINNVLKERRALGKDVMERICRAMKIQPWEFYWTEDTPIVKDKYEREAVDLARRARAAGVAEDVAKYGEYRVNEAKQAGATVKKMPAARHRNTKGRAG